MGGNKKLKNPFSEPYIITEKVSNKNFRLVRGHYLKPLCNKVHINCLHLIDRTVVPSVDEELCQILAEEDKLEELVEADQELVDIDENGVEQGNIAETVNRENADVIEARYEDNETKQILVTQPMTKSKI